MPCLLEAATGVARRQEGKPINGFSSPGSPMRDSALGQRQVLVGKLQPVDDVPNEQGNIRYRVPCERALGHVLDPVFDGGGRGRDRAVERQRLLNVH